MGEGYLNHNKKNYSERRNHGLSLTNLTHCISPSEYYNDYYNNDSFNKINLQLHASSNKVSNPYSFSIKSNTSFSGVVQAALPTTDTQLFRKTTDTIPNGVNIIKVVIKAVGYWQSAEIIIRNNKTNKIWASNHVGPFETNEKIVYIAVTPGKTYTINIEKTPPEHCEWAIYYSAEINTHTPQVKDY